MLEKINIAISEFLIPSMGGAGGGLLFINKNHSCLTFLTHPYLPPKREDYEPLFKAIGILQLQTLFRVTSV